MNKIYAKSNNFFVSLLGIYKFAIMQYPQKGGETSTRFYKKYWV